MYAYAPNDLLWMLLCSDGVPHSEYHTTMHCLLHVHAQRTRKHVELRSEGTLCVLATQTSWLHSMTSWLRSMTLVRTSVIAWLHHRVSLLQSMTLVGTCNYPFVVHAAQQRYR